MADGLYVGRRLSYDGHLCTVRYVGTVQGTKGEWLGVEWDEPSRGKHSGEHNGVRYFACARRAAAGSFVRPSRPFDKPRSVVQALEHKYASEVDARSRKTAASQSAIQISGKEVEEVGFDKIRRRLADLEELRVVLLDGLAVHRPLTEVFERAWNSWAPGSVRDPLEQPGRPTDVRDTCPKVLELDLSRNLFERWAEIASVCEELPDLRSLRCDGNRFRDTSISATARRYFESRFRGVQLLSLEDTLLSWTELAATARLYTGITTFAASCNDLRTLDTSALPHTITTITLEDNGFESLADIRSLRELPNLQKLVLRNNQISKISSTPSADKTTTFQPSLKDVDLSHNAIASWPFIDALHRTFPGQTALRIAHNPLFHNLRTPDGKPLTADDGYILTIGRLARLTSLNYSAVTPKDRLNAETYYLSQVALAVSLLPHDVPAASVLTQHPRYAELCAEYGEPGITRTGPVANPNALAARLMRLHLKADGRWDMTIEVPRRFSVYTIQGLVGKKLGLPPGKLRLIWKTDEADVVASVKQKEVGEPWDSDGDDDGAGPGNAGGASSDKMREVELVAGTREIGTWVDGNEGVIRVEAM
ncbi:hypothetical protein NA57DRAFT_80044 [Rhizodiscina lignyota]|uniref:CAP-Gly domain-containing protein n=1 Tax=Rhizodiscina lignyota TaxID=1504668 RepID=A0A9P4I6M8_9PEZI|nr:hypothetical protein NA57DRAFT_80044 [Rhizodiscina lignyota]